jgi:hypothetical protein
MNKEYRMTRTSAFILFSVPDAPQLAGHVSIGQLYTGQLLFLLSPHGGFVCPVGLAVRPQSRGVAT